MSRTKDYGRKFAAKMHKQLKTTTADLYGGANDVALGAGNQKLLDVLSIDDGVEKVTDTAINGTQIANRDEITAKLPTVEMEALVYEKGITDLIVSALGWENLDGPFETDALGGSGVYSHIIPLNINGKEQREYTTAESLLATDYDADDRINLCTTVAIAEGPSTLIAKNTVIKSFEFSSTQKEPLRFKASGTAESIKRDGTHAGVSTWTKGGGFLTSYKHFNATFSIAKQGDPLENVGITDFSVQITHAMADGIIPTGTSNNGLAQAEPLSDGISEATVNFTIHKHDSDLWKSRENAENEYLWAKMVFTRGDNQIGFYFPALQVITAQTEASGGSSVQVTARLVLPETMTAFAADLLIDGDQKEIPFRTPLFLIINDDDPTNHLRSW